MDASSTEYKKRGFSITCADQDAYMADDDQVQHLQGSETWVAGVESLARER